MDHRHRALAAEDGVDLGGDQGEVGVGPEVIGDGLIKPQADATAEQAPAVAVVVVAEQHRRKQEPFVVRQGRIGALARLAIGGGEKTGAGGEVITGADGGIEGCEGHRQASAGPN